ncbi:hypothetical protein AKJ16_DCAP16264 [Drosera capensis]
MQLGENFYSCNVVSLVVRAGRMGLILEGKNEGKSRSSATSLPPPTPFTSDKSPPVRPLLRSGTRHPPPLTTTNQSSRQRNHQISRNPFPDDSLPQM